MLRVLHFIVFTLSYTIPEMTLNQGYQFGTKQGSYKVITRLPQGCYKIIIGKVITRLLQGCYKFKLLQFQLQGCNKEGTMPEQPCPEVAIHAVGRETAI